MLVGPRQQQHTAKSGGRWPLDVEDLERHALVARGSLRGSYIHRGIAGRDMIAFWLGRLGRRAFRRGHGMGLPQALYFP